MRLYDDAGLNASHIANAALHALGKSTPSLSASA
jgi:hypothetical protein